LALFGFPFATQLFKVIWHSFASHIRTHFPVFCANPSVFFPNESSTAARTFIANNHFERTGHRRSLTGSVVFEMYHFGHPRTAHAKKNAIATSVAIVKRKSTNGNCSAPNLTSIHAIAHIVILSSFRELLHTHTMQTGPAVPHCSFGLLPFCIAASAYAAVGATLDLPAAPAH
jgi:hypothetical protein